MDVRLPDGTIIRNVPEGTTREDLMARLQTGGRQSDINGMLAELDRRQAAPQPAPQHASSNRLGVNTDTLADAGRLALSSPVALAYEAYKNAPPPGQGTSYLAQQLKKGVAAGLGAPVDFLTNALNLGIAGYGVAKNQLTGSSDLPGLISDPTLGSGTFERMFLTNNAIQPTGEVNRVAGRVVRDLGAASVPTAVMARNPAAFMPRNQHGQILAPTPQVHPRSTGTLSTPTIPANTGLPVPANALAGTGQPALLAQSPIPALTVGGVLSTSASLSGELGRALAPDPYKDTADMTGALLGGIALPAAVASRLDAVNQLRDLNKDGNLKRASGNYVEDRLVNDVRNHPGARERLDEALALESEIPGFQPRVGQASGVPSLLDMEHRVAVSGPEQFNRRAIQDAAQRQAIEAEARRRLPLLARNDLEQRISTVQGERTGLADALPQVANEEVGQAMRAGRGSLKAKYDAMAAQKFDAAVHEAEKLRVMINPGSLIQKADELLSNPILKWDPQNAPSVVRRIQALEAKEGSGLLDADGRLIPGSTLKLPFAELKGLREAVNQDIANERRSMSSESRQRLRALLETRDEIDNAATKQAPASVVKSWDDAREFYRDVVAPKFLKGLNIKQTSMDSTGMLRIPDEKLPAQYFKKMASTPMRQFLTLYGESPQVMRKMEDHILDTYRREVVRDGVIDPKRHEVFTRNYEPSLRQVPEIRDNLGNMGRAAMALAERESQIANAKTLLDRGALDRMRFDDPNVQGLDPRKVNAFLTKSGADFEKTVSAAYGEEIAKDHLQNLRKIAKASEIADRGSLHPAAQPQQSTNPLDMRQRIGFGSRTVFNMIRAVTTGRTSSEDVAFTLGMQSATHRISRALIAAEERAISDPTTAKLVADSLNQPITSQAGQSTLRKLLERGGLFVAKTASGSDNYERMGRYRAIPFAIEANQDQE